MIPIFSRPMLSTLRLLTLLLLGAGIGACGTKGPLILPTKPEPVAKPVAPAATRDDDSKAGGSTRQ